jgi:CTP:molybdopterin cytidylyltransferase MocA
MTADIVRRILDEPADLVVATYGGERRHPVNLARRHWGAATAAGSGDEGARRFLKGRSDVVELEIDDKAAGIDLDFLQ